MEQITGLLSALGNEIGIADLSPDDNGACSLFFDELVVNMEYHKESNLLHLYSHLGTLPGDGREELFVRMLEANCFYRGTQGGTLAIDEEADAALLFYQTPVDLLNEADFLRIVENFVNVADTWSGQLSGSGEHVAASEAEPDETPGIRV